MQKIQVTGWLAIDYRLKSGRFLKTKPRPSGTEIVVEVTAQVNVPDPKINRINLDITLPQIEVSEIETGEFLGVDMEKK